MPFSVYEKCYLSIYDNIAFKQPLLAFLDLSRDIEIYCIQKIFVMARNSLFGRLTISIYSSNMESFDRNNMKQHESCDDSWRNIITDHDA